MKSWPTSPGCRPNFSSRDQPTGVRHRARLAVVSTIAGTEREDMRQPVLVGGVETSRWAAAADSPAIHLDLARVAVAMSRMPSDGVI